jgi:hypothetical protein
MLPERAAGAGGDDGIGRKRLVQAHLHIRVQRPQIAQALFQLSDHYAAARRQQIV